MDPLLIHKVVKPGKVVPSRRADEAGLDQPLVAQAKTKMRTANATVLWKPYTAVGWKLGCFDLIDGCREETTEFQALFLGDRGLEVLNLRLMLSHEHDKGYIGNSGRPGVADKLRVEGQQPLGLVGVAARGCLPVHDTPTAVEFTNRINVRNELIGPGQLSYEFDLKILLRPGNMYSIVLRESLKQLDTFVENTIPGLPFLEFKGSFVERAPLLIECSATVFASKVSFQSFLKATSEEHTRPCFLFTPSVEITMTVTARAFQVVGNLCVAINHCCYFPSLADCC